ncbi:PAP2 domain protein [Rhizoctonia solani 123E]|uniref:PAP2 domain protein n=1 Tax=Rhizoctonia solani 123E TaxID=1423351 RepID=A0A074S048_9AGAM|nr:PAP2 domain protein [Rhizoctonia solani 123E]
MGSSSLAPLSSLSVTHVVYDSGSHVSLALALITLSPVLLMACYASLSVYTRELLIINMWAGQLANEGFNWVLKQVFREERPESNRGDGYGFPSSHSQYMGYFSTFLVVHFLTRHRFPNHTSWAQITHRAILCSGLLAWAGIVCYSRYHLTYHTPPQIIWGAIIGACVGATHYLVTELWPAYSPNSPIAQLRSVILNSPIAQWARIRDSWLIWSDGGKEDEYARWKAAWNAQSKIPGNRASGKKGAKLL